MTGEGAGSSPLQPEEFTLESESAIPSIPASEKPTDHLTVSEVGGQGSDPGKGGTEIAPMAAKARPVGIRSSGRVPAALGIAGFAVGAEIGRGAQGVVYRATRVPPAGSPPAPAVEVAIKVLRPEATDVEIERFERAVLAQAVLAGVEGIVHALSRGRTGAGSPYFVMELVRGPSLRALLDEGARDPRELANLVASTAYAVHEAHDRGVVHRDLKPENVLVEAGPEGELLPRICDFGLARDVYRDESQAGGAGTPAYMAPEQITGGEITRRTDVYALGAVLYEMIAGIPPFKKATTAALARAVLEEAPRPPATVWSGLPDALATVALRALEKDPEARYASAAAFGTDIQLALRGETIGGVPMRRVGPRRGVVARALGAVRDAFARRQRFWKGLLAGLLLGLLLGYAAGRFGWLARTGAASEKKMKR